MDHSVEAELGGDRQDALREGFLATSVLADLLYRKRIRRVAERVVAAGDQRYELVSAIKVVACVDGVDDDNSLIGRVETTAELSRSGALFDANLMQLGSAIYRVVVGVLAIGCRG